jgi:hypothetical protein
MKKLSVLVFILIGVSILHSQTLTSIILPQYIEGATSTNANRLPFVFRAKLSGLLASSTYRYVNQVVISTDAATTAGAGNCIFISSAGDFTRTSSPGIAKTYGSFTTDANGEFTGWFITEPTGNARFIPGKYVFMRIALNDGGTGTTAVTYLTTSDSVRVVKLDATSTDSTGTGIRSTTPLSAKQFVFLYDNVAGTGRPVSGTFIESEGTDNTAANSYASFYATSVNAVSGAFGTVIPNNLTTGIQKVEVVSLTDATVANSATDTDGVWPSGANTVNATGGTTEIVFDATTDLGFNASAVKSSAVTATNYSLGQNYPNPFNPSTIIRYSVTGNEHVSLLIYNILGKEVASLVNEYKAAGTYKVEFNGANLPSGIYFYKLSTPKYTEVKKMTLLK